MPSPFPGMDPYLEAPEVFPDFHDSFITYLREFLQAALPAPYFAALGRRVWIEDAHDEFREPFVEIYIRDAQGKRLVTSLEVLSLSNKTPGAHGRDLYLRKQKEVLAGQVHLVEIDLLRAGEHVTAVPVELARSSCGPFDYHVAVHRFDDLETFLVYPIALADRLPTIAVPLLPGEADVPLDLQAVFERCYEAGPYRREIQYDTDAPVPPLRPDQAAWATQLLHARRGD